MLTSQCTPERFQCKHWRRFHVSASTPFTELLLQKMHQQKSRDDLTHFGNIELTTSKPEPETPFLLRQRYSSSLFTAIYDDML